MIERKKFVHHVISKYDDGIYILTHYGKLKVWANESGLYLDLLDPTGDLGDICLFSLHPEYEGLHGFMYGNLGSANSTTDQVFKAKELENVFNCVKEEIDDEFLWEDDDEDYSNDEEYSIFR